MYIKKLHVAAFGPIVDRDFNLENGLNIIEGKNESGKSALSMFIKFLFYGLSSRTPAGGVSERTKYINIEKNYAAGYGVLALNTESGIKEIRIERILTARSAEGSGKLTYAEKLSVLDNETSMPLAVGSVPGEYFFGVPETVFMSTAFSSQESTVRPDTPSVKASVENIICSADETVSVKNAVDVLERERISLCHKNRTGGKIIELEEKCDALRAELEISRGASSDFRRAEASLADVKQNIKAAEARAAELERSGEAHDAADIVRRGELAEECRARLSELDREKSALLSLGITEKFLSELTVSLSDIKREEAARREHEEKFRGRGHETAEETERDARRADSVERGGAVLRALGVIMIITAVLGAAGFAYLYVLEQKVSPLPLGIAVLAFILSVTFMSLSAKRFREVDAILNVYDVETIDDLFDKADELESGNDEYSRSLAELRSAKDAADRAELTMKGLARGAGIESQLEGKSPRECALILAKLASTTTTRLREIEAEAAGVRGRLEGAGGEPDAAALDEAREITQALGDEAGAREAIDRERAFLKTKLENLRRRELDLERELAAMKAVASSPASVFERLEAAEEKLRLARETHEAVCLAIEKINEASGNIRSSCVPRISLAAGDIIKRLTGGKYGEITLTPEFDLSFRTDALGTHDVDLLSGGTRDAAYTALRIALTHALFDGTTPPMIFDESFAYLDEERLAEVLRLLAGERLQTLLFTCRRLESTLTPETNVVKM